VADPENWLLVTRLRAVAARLADPAASAPDADAAWREAMTAVTAAGAEEDAAVALPVLERDPKELAALLRAWDERKASLSAWDQAVLKRAMNSFKKRLKVTRADDSGSGSRNPLSRGASSSILGVRAPEQYTPDVWALLVAQGRLRDGGDGLLEPAGDSPAGS
jgi:hypothetical protein